MPLRKIAFISSAFALAEPVPFTVAILIAKSFVRSWVISCALGHLGRVGGGFILGVRPLHEGLLHVPGGRRAALGAQAAVHAEVFVFDHDAAGMFQRRRYVQ